MNINFLQPAVAGNYFNSPLSNGQPSFYAAATAHFLGCHKIKIVRVTAGENFDTLHLERGQRAVNVRFDGKQPAAKLLAQFEGRVFVDVRDDE